MFGIELTGTELTLVSAAIGAITGFSGWRIQRRKVDSEEGHSTADAAAMTVASALSLIEPLQQQLSATRGELEALQTQFHTAMADMRSMVSRVDCLETAAEADRIEIDGLSEGVRVLTGQVKELGDTPRWPPASGRYGPMP